MREMSLDEARFAVHAGFALVVDLGRFVHYAPSESALAVVRHLVLTTLLGDGEQPPASMLQGLRFDDEADEHDRLRSITVRFAKVRRTRRYR